MQSTLDCKVCRNDRQCKTKFLSEISNGTKTVNDFAVGLSYDNIKLKPYTVDGGVVLKPTPFEIKGVKTKG